MGSRASRAYSEQSIKNSLHTVTSQSYQSSLVIRYNLSRTGFFSLVQHFFSKLLLLGGLWHWPHLSPQWRTCALWFPKVQAATPSLLFPLLAPTACGQQKWCTNQIAKNTNRKRENKKVEIIHRYRRNINKLDTAKGEAKTRGKRDQPTAHYIVVSL